MRTTTLARRMFVIGLAWAMLPLAGLTQAQNPSGTIFYRDVFNSSSGMTEPLGSVHGDGTGNTVLIKNAAPASNSTPDLSVSNDLYSSNGLTTRRWLELVRSGPQPLCGSGQVFIVVPDASGNAVSTQISGFNDAADGFAVATPIPPPQWSSDDASIYFTVANYNVSPVQVSLVRFPTSYLAAGIVATKDNVEYLSTWPVPDFRHTRSDYTVSPDGSTLAYVDASVSPSTLVVLDLASQSPRVIATGGVSKPQWSPDGSRIAYETSRTVNSVSYGCIYTVRPSIVGDTPRAVQLGGGTTSWGQLSFGKVVWSPDSTGLAFGVKAVSKKGTSTYWIGKSSSTGGAVTQLTPALAFPNNCGPLAWLN